MPRRQSARLGQNPGMASRTDTSCTARRTDGKPRFRTCTGKRVRYPTSDVQLILARSYLDTIAVGPEALSSSRCTLLPLAHVHWSVAARVLLGASMARGFHFDSAWAVYVTE